MDLSEFFNIISCMMKLNLHFPEPDPTGSVFIGLDE